MLDTSLLTPTSAKRGLRWRDTSLTFVWLRTSAPVVVAHKIADKLEVLTSRSAEDVVLAIRQVQYPTRQEVMVVDDAATALAALRGRE